MTQVSECVIFRNIRLNTIFTRDILLRMCIFCLSYFEISQCRIHLSMTPKTCRQYTIKHIYPPCYSFFEIFWSTHSHEIVGFIFGHVWLEDIQCVIHILSRFPNRKPSDSNAWSLQISQKFDRLDSQIIKIHTLNNRKICLEMFSLGLAILLQGKPFFLALFCPTMRSIECQFGSTFGSSARNNIIKSHDNIRTQTLLDLDRFLWCKKMFIPIEMRSKFNSHIRDFCQCI